MQLPIIAVRNIVIKKQPNVVKLSFKISLFNLLIVAPLFDLYLLMCYNNHSILKVRLILQFNKFTPKCQIPKTK